MSTFNLNNRRLDYLSRPTIDNDSIFSSDKGISTKAIEDPNDFYLAEFDSTPTHEVSMAKSAVRKGPTIGSSGRIVPPPRSSSYTAGSIVSDVSPGDDPIKGPALHNVRPLEIKKKRAGAPIAYHGASKPIIVAKAPKPYPSPRSPRNQYHLSAPISPSPLSRRPSLTPPILMEESSETMLLKDALASSGSDEEYITESDQMTDGEGMMGTPPGRTAHNVGSRFLSMSNADHGILSPPHSLPHAHSMPIVPISRRISHTSNASRTSTTRSSSDFHLGLGNFYPYDERAAPGPSPPISPSPTRRTFLLDTKTGQITEVRTGKSGFPVPPPRQEEEDDEGLEEPMTPSRAGSKAIQMLGSSKPVDKGSKSMMDRVTGGKRRKVEHFKPLPSSVLREIDLIFGKPAPKAKNPSVSSGSRPSQKCSASGPALTAKPGLGDRKVGEGRTVEIVDEQGRVWQDLEEQQEFAWLLSEQGRGGDRYKVVSPVLISRSGFQDAKLPLDGWDENDNVIVINTDGTGAGIASGGGTDDFFGMTKFVNVLNLPKPKKAPFVLGSDARYGEQPLAFLSKDPYAGTLKAADVKCSSRTSPEKRSSPVGPQDKDKRRPAPLDLAQGRPSNTKHIIAVQPESGSTMGHGPPPPLLSRSTGSSARVPTTPYVTPRTAPLPPFASNSSDSRSVMGANAPSSRSSSERTLSSSPDKSTRELMKKGQSFFDTELSPKAGQQTFSISISISGARRKASGALNQVLRRVGS